ncbi:hypothetical protein [Phaeobacter sp. C3_T13_0]|uniref:hypothetical protein n=1 Tax=Phaeobacter cretensis TaxID=3342641 RepID=UPI0039BD122F
MTLRARLFRKGSAHLGKITVTSKVRTAVPDPITYRRGGFQGQFAYLVMLLWVE